TTEAAPPSSAQQKKNDAGFAWTQSHTALNMVGASASVHRAEDFRDGAGERSEDREGDREPALRPQRGLGAEGGRLFFLLSLELVRRHARGELGERELEAPHVADDRPSLVAHPLLEVGHALGDLVGAVARPPLAPFDLRDLGARLAELLLEGADRGLQKLGVFCHLTSGGGWRSGGGCVGDFRARARRRRRRLGGFFLG